jgi:catechol-2,3-dioxygenase
MLGGLVLGAATPAAAQTKAAAGALSRNNRPLGARLQGVQHFGLTVQNMDRAYAFYTEVLGGTEVMRDGDFMASASTTPCSPIRRSRRACAK